MKCKLETFNAFVNFSVFHLLDLMVLVCGLFKSLFLITALGREIMRGWPLSANSKVYMRQSVAPEDRVDGTIRPDDTATSRETFLSFKEQQRNADKALNTKTPPAPPHLLENNSPYALQSLWASISNAFACLHLHGCLWMTAD